MVNLTDRTIRGAKCPGDLNQADLPDGQVRGLMLRVYRSGVKTWVLHYRRRDATGDGGSPSAAIRG